MLLLIEVPPANSWISCACYNRNITTNVLELDDFVIPRKTIEPSSPQEPSLYNPAIFILIHALPKFPCERLDEVQYFLCISLANPRLKTKHICAQFKNFLHHKCVAAKKRIPVAVKTTLCDPRYWRTQGTKVDFNVTYCAASVIS